MLTRFGDFDRTFSAMDQLPRLLSRWLEDEERTRARDTLRGSLVDEVDRSFGPARFPRLTLADAGASLVLRAELPGLTEKQIQLSIHQDTFTMTGERAPDAPEVYNAHLQERAPLRFGRTFTLPCKVDPEKSTAVLQDGVLTVTLAKAPEAQPRQISVKVA